MRTAHVRRLSTGTLFCSFCHQVLPSPAAIGEHTHDATPPQHQPMLDGLDIDGPEQ